MSNFAFLQAEWPLLHESATKAEDMAHTDARASCFYARRTLEMAVAWLYKHDRGLRLPYQDNLSALIHEPTFAQVVGQAVFTKAKVIKELGNQAVHSARKVLPADAVVATRELFHIGYWLARTYGQRGRPDPGLAFNPALLARPATAAPAVPPQTLDQLQKLQAQLAERDERLSTLLGTTAALDAELARLREEVAAAKQANAAIPDTHDYSEAQTRDYFIDLLLKEAGWQLDPKKNFEIEVTGMPNEKGKGFVDYVLWGDDGKPLALVEAKRTKKSAKVGQQQAKLYADCLEAQYGQRPVIFCSNGYEHWVWDDAMYPPRAVQGFYKKAELALMIQRRTSRKPLATAAIDAGIIERYYQVRTVRRIGETFEKHHLHQLVAAMNVENFVVRPQRRMVEKFARPEAWETLNGDDQAELASHVASLPTEFVDADEEAKRFDLLVLRTQLAILQAAPGFAVLRDQIRAIASALEEQEAVPAIQAEMVLIQAIAGDEWWNDVTLGMLENARRRLRLLVKLIEKSKKKVVYTDFRLQPSARMS